MVLNEDNAETREAVEFCYQRQKTVLNPIIDWDDSDVWEFIHEYNVPYCKLYDEGYKRLGCIGCPMSSRQIKELDAYPKYKQAYIRAFDKMLKDKDVTTWKTAEDVYKWWIRE